MKKVLAALFFALFAVFLSHPVLATVEGDALRQFDEAIAVVLNLCTYKINFKMAGAPPAKKLILSYGNGFFIEHAGAPHKLLTAGHVVTCEQTLPDEFFSDGIRREDVASFEVSNVIQVAYKKTWYPAAVAQFISATFRKRTMMRVRPDLFVGYGLAEIYSGYDIDSSAEDAALLDVILPDWHMHRHATIGLEQIYDLNTNLLIRGYLQGIDHGLRLRSGPIEWIGQRFLEINTHVYPGLSGSAVLVFKDDRLYVVGIAVATFFDEKMGYIDTTIVTRLTKDLMDQLFQAKTAP